MKLKLPAYNGKDNLVMLIISPVFAIAVNSINLEGYFSNGFWYFFLASITSILIFCIQFIVCGAIAIFFKKRFPEERQLSMRLTFMILSFLLLTGLFLLSLFSLLESIPYFNYRFNDNAFAWSYLALGIINIFLTFLMEGINRYQEWQVNRRETEKLNRAYKQSQLHGLKSQVNPHFLFNSLNSLSSLIQENEAQAEKFLDEMSKVYRYMLRTDDEPLVSLDTELQFAASYLHLLKARYGDGLKLEVDIRKNAKSMLIAPLTLQVIIETAFSQNILSKANPLLISIASQENGSLVVEHNLQPKSITGELDFEEGLDNLIKKYELMNLPIAVTEGSTGKRVIHVPLVQLKGEAP